MIPKILHQTWKNSELPDELQTWQSTWRDLHPDWQYRLWTDEENRQFVADEYAEFLPRYDEYPAAIQRVDAVRYLQLFTYGGVYIDLDTWCRRTIDPLLAGCQSLFAQEPLRNCEIHHQELIVSNAFMACVPGDPFLARVIERLKTQAWSNNILHSTGPFMLTEEYLTTNTDVKLIPSESMFPLHIEDVESARNNGWSQQLEAKIQHAYGVHMHMGTWWRPN